MGIFSRFNPIRILSQLAEYLEDLQNQSTEDFERETRSKRAASDENRNNKTALMYAVMGEDLEAVKEILKDDECDPNAVTTTQEKTALMYAIDHKNKEIIEELLKIDNLALNQKNKFGKTALDMAKEYRYEDIYKDTYEDIAVAVKEYYESKANSEDNQDNKTALMFAVMNEDLGAVRELLKDNKCDPNALTTENWTALMYAVNYANEEVVKELLGVEGLSLDLEDNLGKTAFDMSKEYKYEDIATAILNSKAANGLKEKSLDEWLCELDPDDQLPDMGDPIYDLADSGRVKKSIFARLNPLNILSWVKNFFEDLRLGGHMEEDEKNHFGSKDDISPLLAPLNLDGNSKLGGSTRKIKRSIKMDGGASLESKAKEIPVQSKDDAKKPDLPVDMAEEEKENQSINLGHQ